MMCSCLIWKKRRESEKFMLWKGRLSFFLIFQTVFSDMWIRNYIEKTPYLSLEDTIADYKENPGKYYGMLKA